MMESKVLLINNYFYLLMKDFKTRKDHKYVKTIFQSDLGALLSYIVSIMLLSLNNTKHKIWAFEINSSMNWVKVMTF